MVCINERVRFVDTDMMGVVHHSNYFRWFEAARVAYLKEAGVDLWDLMNGGYSFPISDVRCAYKIPARYDDSLEIFVRMIELSRAKMVFCYQVRRQNDNELLAEGYTCNIFTNDKGKVTRLPAKYYDALKIFSDAEASTRQEREM